MSSLGNHVELETCKAINVGIDRPDLYLPQLTAAIGPFDSTAFGPTAPLVARQPRPCRTNELTLLNICDITDGVIVSWVVVATRSATAWMRCASGTHRNQLAGGPPVAKAGELCGLQGDLLEGENAARSHPNLTAACTVFDALTGICALTQVLAAPERMNPGVDLVMLWVVV